MARIVAEGTWKYACCLLWFDENKYAGGFYERAFVALCLLGLVVLLFGVKKMAKPSS